MPHPRSEPNGTESQDAQVLVVGAGPVGLVLALDLAQRGIDVHVIERSAEPRFLPKMERCNARTMEIFRRLGIAEQVRAASRFTDVPMDVFVTTSLADPPLLHLEYPSSNRAREMTRASTDGSLPLEPYQLISQYTLEPLLREVLVDHPNATLTLGCELVSFDQDDAGVTAQVLADGEPRSIRSSYLVGCDGGVSTVRKQLGIQLEGDGRIARVLQIFFRSPTLFEDITMGPGRHYYTPRGALIVQDDLQHFMVNAFDSDDTTDPVAKVHDVLGIPVEIEVLATNPWWLHLLVAERYGHGRVMLAGDAVHLVIPQGGLGMNTGVGDAINLSWKLAAALQGWGGPEVLASYESERRPVGLRNREASRQATAGLRSWQELCTPDMQEDTAEAAAVRQQVAEAAAVGQRIGHEMSGVELGYRYDGSPLIVSERGDPPDADAMSYEPSTWPGVRLPHMWRADGTALHDQIGPDFTLLRLGGTGFDTTALEKAIRARGAHLDVLDVDEPEIRKVYDCDLLLVRPDLHVAWRGNQPPTDPASVADTVTGLRAGTHPTG